LLGAYVLDACDPVEAVAVEAHLAGCSECASEETGLREVVGLLAAADEAPPAHLEANILAAASSPPDPAVAAYREAAGALDAVLASMADDDWDRPATGDWTCRDMVAHLCAIDSLLVTTLGYPPRIPEQETDFLE